MKYLENASLENLSNFLTNREIGGCILTGRVEAFSCKRAGDISKLIAMFHTHISMQRRG
jgi:hypothetical protein